jgi:hypothetical protein
VFTHVDGSAFISGQVLTIAKAAFSDMGAAATTMAADKTATASTDSSAPTATATISSTTVTQGTTVSLGTGSQIVIKSLATGVATGTLGSLWSIQGIEGTAGATPIVSLYDGSNRKVVIAADFSTPTTASTPTATNICAAFNAHAEASATFNCTVVVGNVASTAVWGATYLTGGSELSVIDITWSETMNNGAHVDQSAFDTLTYYNVDADGSGTIDADETDGIEAIRLAKCTVTVAQTETAAGCGSSTGANSFIAGTMQILYTSDVYTERLTAGSSQLQITAQTAADIKGNDASGAGVTYKITMS